MHEILGQQANEVNGKESRVGLKSETTRQVSNILRDLPGSAVTSVTLLSEGDSSAGTRLQSRKTGLDSEKGLPISPTTSDEGEERASGGGFGRDPLGACNTRGSNSNESTEKGVQVCDLICRNVKSGDILESGIDTLHLAMTVDDRRPEFLSRMEGLNPELFSESSRLPVVGFAEGVFPWHLLLNKYPYGHGGYRYVMGNEYYYLKSWGPGSWGKRPNVIVQVKGAAFREIGYPEAVEDILEGIRVQIGGYQQNKVTVARVNLYADEIGRAHV